MDEGNLDTEAFAGKFGAVEYVVFSMVLAFSAAIGIYFGCFGSKQKTTEEFLMANRQMTPIPVALSLLCSFVSALTILGIPAEVYFYGMQNSLMILSFISLTLSLHYLYVPVFFKLQLSSVYEYLEMRFSKGTRIFVSLLSIFYLTVYMAIVVLGPSLALEQVAGIDTKLSTGAIFMVCIFYSSIGGLKAVLWTDTFQAVIILGSLMVIVVKGLVDEGGLSAVWERAAETSRTELLRFDTDPRTRYTVWTCVIGGYFCWLSVYATTQAQVQRYLSLPSLDKVRNALIINMLGLMLVWILVSFTGLVIYSRFQGCDPLKTKIITNSDQLLPLYAMESFRNIPGLPGLFVGGLACASLSTVSSGLSALASIVTYDYIRKGFPNFSDEKLSQMSRGVTFIFGCLSFGFGFVAEKMGNILPAGASFTGVIVGPTLGIFVLGMFFPWSNTKGALTGLVTTLVLMMSYSIGVYITNNYQLLPNQKLSLSIDKCISFSNGTDAKPESIYNPISSMDWKDKDDSVLIQILSTSYIWFPTLGAVSTVFIGIIASFCFTLWEDAREKKFIRAELLSPPMYALWKYLFPKSMKQLVQSDKDLMEINYFSQTNSSSNGNAYSQQYTGFTGNQEGATM